MPCRYADSKRPGGRPRREATHRACVLPCERGRPHPGGRGRRRHRRQSGASTVGRRLGCRTRRDRPGRPGVPRPFQLRSHLVGSRIAGHRRDRVVRTPTGPRARRHRCHALRPGSRDRSCRRTRRRRGRLHHQALPACRAARPTARASPSGDEQRRRVAANSGRPTWPSTSPPRRAWVGETELDLRPKEFDLLAYLVRAAGQVVRREQIMADVWDQHWWGSTKTLDIHVAAVRRKLGEPTDEASRITTVRGVGYRFEER